MATPASDVYSAGVVAFEMLTGELPFAAETPVGVAMRHVHDPAPRPSHVVSGLQPQIDPIILRALATLLWTGFRNLPDPVEPTPSSVVVPPAPVITGGIDQDAENSDGIDP